MMTALKTFLCRHRSGLLTFALFALCVFAAFLMRTWHYNTSVHALAKAIGDVPQTELSAPGMLPAFHKNFAPFTIESAMMFTYAQDIATGKGVPARDELLNGMEDIPPYGQMSMTLEWFLGWGWRIKNFFAPDPPPSENELRFQDHPRMAQWMSGQLRFWASITSGLLFLWLVVMGCPRKFAVIAGLLHAVSPAAIARSTGQDIVHGEFCIPLIMAAFVLAYSIYRKPQIWKYILLFCTTALAFATWDLCQMLFGAWAAYEVLRLILKYRFTKTRLYVWLTITAAVLFNAAFVPFYHVYSLWRAQILWTVLPTLFIGGIYLMKHDKRTKLRFLIPVLFLGLHLFWSVCINTPEYASNYSHFSEAMNAKLAFWNEKPLDPEKISYDARMLWTPAMTSVTWETSDTFFPSLRRQTSDFRPWRFLTGCAPASLLLFAILLGSALLFTPVRNVFLRHGTVNFMPVLFTVGFLIGYIYIIRYHEFLIIFLAVSLALLVRDHAQGWKMREVPAGAPPWMNIYRHKKLTAVLRWCPGVLFALLLWHETDVSYSARRFYTGDVAMRQTAMLIEWMRSDPARFKGKGVAANFTIGPMLRAYAGTGVAMNPQFGIKRLRDATELYLMALYHGSEEDMAEYFRERNVSFLVFVREDPDSVPVPQLGLHLYASSRAELDRIKRIYTPSWIYGNRYIAGAEQIGPDVFYRQLYRASMPGNTNKNELKYFRVVPLPEKWKALAATHAVFEFVPGGIQP